MQPTPPTLVPFATHPHTPAHTHTFAHLFYLLELHFPISQLHLRQRLHGSLLPLPLSPPSFPPIPSFLAWQPFSHLLTRCLCVGRAQQFMRLSNATLLDFYWQQARSPWQSTWPPPLTPFSLFAFRGNCIEHINQLNCIFMRQVWPTLVDPRLPLPVVLLLLLPLSAAFLTPSTAGRALGCK